MKPNIIERNVVVNLPNASKQFTLENSPKAFQILSSNLYTDKPRAIIRELCCNAYDAHVTVGKEKVPFDIRLPDRMQPTLSIRDYGPGLDYDTVMGLYTTYFASDKIHTNDLIGGQGLGSKSPFSYVDTFSVISRQHGRQWTYSAYLTEERLPNITMLGYKDADDEPDGLEIIIPIQPNDFQEFRNKASSVLMHFPVKPKNIDVQKPDYILETDSCKILGSLNYRSKQTVVMGHVPYEIPSNFFEEHVPKTSLFHNMHAHFQAPVGTLNFQPSREQLTMDKHTIKELTKIVTRARVEVEFELNARVMTADTVIEAIKLASRFGIESIEYRGKKIKARVTRSMDFMSYRTWGDKLESSSTFHIDYLNTKKIFKMSHRKRLQEILIHNGIAKSECIFLMNWKDACILEEDFDIPKIKSVGEALTVPKRETSETRTITLKQYGGGYTWNDLSASLQGIEDDDTNEYCWVEIDNNACSLRTHTEMSRHIKSLTVIGVPRSMKYLDKKMPCMHITDYMKDWVARTLSDPYYYSAYNLNKQQHRWISRAGFSCEDQVQDLLETRPILSEFVKLSKFIHDKRNTFGAIQNLISPRNSIETPKTKPQKAQVIFNRFRKKYPMFYELLSNDRWGTLNLKHYRHYISLIERRRSK